VSGRGGGAGAGAIGERAGGAAGGEFGTLERAGDVSILRYERRLAHAREKVWRALTEDEELAA